MFNKGNELIVECERRDTTFYLDGVELHNVMSYSITDTSKNYANYIGAEVTFTLCIPRKNLKYVFVDNINQNRPSPTKNADPSAEW